MSVRMQDPTESITAAYVKACNLCWISDRFGQWPQWPGVGNASMRPVPVVEVLELPQRVQQVLPVPDQGAVQQFTAARPYPPLHDRIHAWYPDAGEHDLHTRISQHGIENTGKLPVPVAVQVPGSGSGVLQIHDQVTGSLGDPRGGRVRGRAQDPYPAGRMLYHRQHEHPRPTQGDGFEEVTGQQRVGLGTQEASPRIGAAPIS
jgi:hypothetical protein